MNKIIGLLGLKGSGKDTVGQYFEHQYGYTTISFADSLKNCVSVIFGWDREMLEGRTPQSREWREQNDPWWAKKLGLEFFSPRVAMTTFGTDVMRKHFRDDIWIINTERKIQQYDRVVITDVRFPNELKMINDMLGHTIRVTRGPEPKWSNLALSAIQGDDTAKAELDRLEVHESEWLLYNHPTNTVLTNDSSIGDLYDHCERIFSSAAT
jgi:hypothetical protein